jgi:Flagellar hook capping protein
MNPTPGTSNTTLSSVDNNQSTPKSFSLGQNYPNPFNPQTQFHYSLKNTENIYLAIYDLLGREIYTIHDGQQRSGNHNVQWTGINNQGDLAPSGVYFCRLKTEAEVLTKKMVLNR